MRLLVARYHWCTGCHACELACRQEHGHELGRYGLRVERRGPQRFGGELDFVPRPTARCDLCAGRGVPACVACCPTRCLAVAPAEELEALRVRWRAGEKLAFWGYRSAEETTPRRAGDSHRERLVRLLLESVDVLELPRRARNGLANARIHRVHQLVSCSETQLLAMRQMGRMSVGQVVDSLAASGLGLEMFPPIDPLKPPAELRRALLAALGCRPGPRGAQEAAPVKEEVMALLNAPWSEHFRIHCRASSQLRRHGLRTVADLLRASDDELLALDGLGGITLRRIRQACHDLLVASPFEYAMLRMWFQLDTEGMTERPLRALGPACERLLGALELERSLATVGDLALWTLEQGRDAIQSPQATRAGAILRGYLDVGIAEIPWTLPELLVCALAGLPALQVQVARGHLLQGRSQASVAVELQWSRQRVSQVVTEVLGRLRSRWGHQVEPLVASIRSQLEAAGMLHYGDLEAQGLPPAALALCLSLTMPRRIRLWRDSFLYSSHAIKPNLVLRKTRAWLREACVSALDLADERPAGLLGSLGWSPPEHTWRQFLLLLGPTVDHSPLRRRVEAALARAKVPMHALELVPQVLPAYDGQRLAGLPIRKRNQLVSRISMATERASFVHRVDHGTFVHRTALPLPWERLWELAEWCVERIRGEQAAVSTRQLLHELQRHDLAPPGLTPTLLKDTLNRHPKVVTLRKSYVGHADSLLDRNRSIAGPAMHVLLQAERPLTITEINERMADEAPFLSTDARQLATADALRVSGRSYVHIRRLGIDAAARARLVEDVVALLPDDGAPVGVAELMEYVEDAWTMADLVDDRSRAEVLWGLLRRDERLRGSAGWRIRLVSPRGR